MKNFIHCPTCDRTLNEINQIILGDTFYEYQCPVCKNLFSVCSVGYLDSLKKKILSYEDFLSSKGLTFKEFDDWMEKREVKIV